jgi:hypothetical protein
MADSLKAEVQMNALLRDSGRNATMGQFFDRENFRGKTRISVINLIGLPSPELQQLFVNQLTISLYLWIKQKEEEKPGDFKGLLIFDESRDFAPSARPSLCRENLKRLATFAKSRGFGLVFATQVPNDIDHGLVSNCAIQFYGRANSPSAISAIKEQIVMRGSGEPNISRLKTGHFYLHLEKSKGFHKILTPFCLSYFPPKPLDETQVLARALKSRPRMISIEGNKNRPDDSRTAHPKK